MALTIAEASAVNAILDYFYGDSSAKPTPDEILGGCVMLAQGASRRLGAGWTPRQVADAAGDRWYSDFVQFPRLLAELVAVGLKEDQYDALAASMDLDRTDIDELLDRAQAYWDAVKNAG